MRIVSQDNNWNFPYKLCGLAVFSIYPDGCCVEPSKYEILAYFNGGHGFRMATYSTRQKADKAMEMLNMAYCGIVEPIKIDAVPEFKDGMCNVNLEILKDRQPDIECRVWKFPQDSEVIIDGENSNA